MNEKNHLNVLTADVLQSATSHLGLHCVCFPFCIEVEKKLRVKVHENNYYLRVGKMF